MGARRTGWTNIDRWQRQMIESAKEKITTGNASPQVGQGLPKVNFASSREIGERLSCVSMVPHTNCQQIALQLVKANI